MQSSLFLVDIRHCWTSSLLVYRSANSVSSRKLARVLFCANTSITVTATSTTPDIAEAISHRAECRFLSAEPVVAWSAGSWESMPALLLCAGYPMTPELPVTPQVMPATLIVHLSKIMSLFLVGVLGLTPPCDWIESSSSLPVSSSCAPNHMLLFAPPNQCHSMWFPVSLRWFHT